MAMSSSSKSIIARPVSYAIQATTRDARTKGVFLSPAEPPVPHSTSNRFPIFFVPPFSKILLKSLKRYQDNADVLIEGMSKLGFKCYVPDAVRGCIITSFLVPNHPRWDFDVFYDKLNDAGFAIYPGSMTKVPTFRVGNIGHIFTKDMIDFIICVEDIMAEMGMTDMWQVQSEGREEAPKKTIGASM